jgi:hypothetical protein
MNLLTPFHFRRDGIVTHHPTPQQQPGHFQVTNARPPNRQPERREIATRPTSFARTLPPAASFKRWLANMAFESTCRPVRHE